MTSPLILAIDQGTSSTKVIVVDSSGAVVAHGSAPLALRTPQPGWVEHEAGDIIASVHAAVAEACATIDSSRIAAVGISNQRESLVLWDRITGKAISPVVSWQDRRTTELCEDLLASGHGPRVRAISGLPLDPMFSAAKAAWLIREYADDGTVDQALGTVDSWLAWCLTGEHVIEAGNASRTSLVDLSTGDWSGELLGIFGIPASVLPRIVDSVGSVGLVRDLPGVPDGTPLSGILGDSHAALFAHAGWRPGVIKATYGTGSSVMALTGDAAVDSEGLCRTIAWRLPGDAAAVAWEANILSTGATLQWLATVLNRPAAELAAHAARDSGGVVLVPAFNGLGAPWWSRDAQAIMVGMSLATGAAELSRAALDSTILQVADVVDCMVDVGVPASGLVADGGASDNLDLMGRQAGILGLPIQVSANPGLSALGAAYAAGVGAGIWSMTDLESMPREYINVEPSLDEQERRTLTTRWRAALDQSMARS